MKITDSLVTRKHLQSILGVSEASLIRYEKQGMPSIRIGRGKGKNRLVRYDLAQVMAWISSQDTKGFNT